VNGWQPRFVLPGTQVPLTVDGDVFASAAAGQVIAPGALVVDVGQTALKLVYGGERWHGPRDFGQLPIASELPDDEWPARRARVIEFVAGAIRQVPARPPALVLALPCALDGDLVASGCSYPYPKPDPALVGDLVQASGLAGIPTFVLNDAELAAVAAARDSRVSRRRPALVLTVGFGVGAALLRART
jgi:predicted NBD/HSP70 family sugar kinase